MEQTKNIQTKVTIGTHLILHMEASAKKTTLAKLLRLIIDEWIKSQPNQTQLTKGDQQNGSKETSEKSRRQCSNHQRY